MRLARPYGDNRGISLDQLAPFIYNRHQVPFMWAVAEGGMSDSVGKYPLLLRFDWGARYGDIILSSWGLTTCGVFS